MLLGSHDLLICEKSPLNNASRLGCPSWFIFFCSVVRGLDRRSRQIYRGWNTLHVIWATVRPQAGSESISVNLLHGNCVAGVDRCGASCLCSAVNPVLYSISMLSKSRTLEKLHIHIRVLWSVFVWISLDSVCIKKKKKTTKKNHSCKRWGL